MSYRLRVKGRSTVPYSLNMELDLHSLFELHVHSCTHWLRPRNSPLPPHLGSYTRALLVSQDRRRLFVTPLGRRKMQYGRHLCTWIRINTFRIRIQQLNLQRIHADPDSHPHPRYPAWSELDFYSKCWLICEFVPKLADPSKPSKLSAAVYQVSM
jgi:hypothetical protein